LGSIRKLKISGLILRHPAPQFSLYKLVSSTNLGYFKRQDYWTNFFYGTITIQIFFPKKLTIPIFSGTLTAVRYREIIQQCLEQQQPHDDEIVNEYFQENGAPAHTTYENLNMLQGF
jgi:hypothetical protein